MNDKDRVRVIIVILTITVVWCLGFYVVLLNKTGNCDKRVTFMDGTNETIKDYHFQGTMLNILPCDGTWTLIPTERIKKITRDE